MKFIIMKALGTFIIALCLSGLSKEVFAQDPVKVKISVTAEKTSIKKILQNVEKQYNFRFFYDEKNIDVSAPKTIDVTGVSLENFIGTLFDNSVTYSISNKGLITLSKVLKHQKNSTSNAVFGTVKDLSGVPLAGVFVHIKGTQHRCYTDIEGNFTFKGISSDATLTFDYTGMKTIIVPITNNGEKLSIIMEEDAVALDEVIITGYGTFKKSAYAGSASTIKTDGIKDVPTMSVSSMLQANAPGVSVSLSSGQPGAAPSVRIRGLGSFNASNSPLYVIDGVPVISGDINNSGSEAGTDMMATINPSDIENITVIKDAAAASLYGSRAANGVILITTKQGKRGKTVFNFKSDWGFSDFAYRYRPSMQGDERRDFIYNSMIRRAVYQDGKSEAEAKVYADSEIDKVAPIPWCGWVDWEKILLRKGSHQNYEFSLSGGAEKFTYYSSVSYTDQQGVQYSQSLSRVTGRVNVKYDAKSWLQVGANLLFSDINQNIGSDGTQYTSPLYSSKHKLTPSDPVYNEDGSYNVDLLSNGSRNPKASLDYDYDRQRVTRSFNTIYADIKFMEPLHLKSTFSYDHTTSKAKSWTDSRTSSGATTQGSANKSYYDYNQMVWSTNLNYVKTFKKVHHFDALIAYEISEYKRDYLSGAQKGFANPDYNEIGNGANPTGVGGNSAQWRLVSYISKVNYDYKNKYYAGASYRLDGTSRLHRDSRWGNFWSLSGAWRFSKEKFFKGLKHLIPDAKLRVSYGVNGTLPSSYYAYMSLTSLSSSYNNKPGMSESNLANDNLKWESNYTLNIGLDFTIKEFLNVQFEYYNRITRNLLMDMPISLTNGFSSYMDNIGKVRNRGIELTLTSTNFSKKNFYWSSSFNIGHNRNKILVLDGNQTEIISGTQIRRVGMPYYTYYMIEFAGINPENGKPQFYTNEVGADGKLIKNITEKSSEANPIATKTPLPNVSLGLTNTFRYKIFDLSFTLSSTFGGWSYDSAAQKSQTSGSGDGAINQIPLYYRDSWQKPGDITKYEAWIYGNSSRMSSPANTRRLHSTDHVRLKNLTFGVSLPKSWTTKAGISRARLFFSGYNLLTWAAFNEYDPEVPTNGSVMYNTPPLKTMTFGIDINF